MNGQAIMPWRRLCWRSGEESLGHHILRESRKQHLISERRHCRLFKASNMCETSPEAPLTRILPGEADPGQEALQACVRKRDLDGTGPGIRSTPQILQVLGLLKYGRIQATLAFLAQFQWHFAISGNPQPPRSITRPHRLVSRPAPER